MKKLIAGSLALLGLLGLLVLLAGSLGGAILPGPPAGVSPASEPATTSAAARVQARPYRAVVEVDDGDDGTVDWRTVYQYDGEGRLQQVQSTPVVGDAAPATAGQRAPGRAPGDV
ncbi:MAG: hypothetical protein RBU45_11225 [Myxococcota bacterium]|jgi:hypothetical protein|nr:hypothetical protein [Myxococcota bacterium]